MAEYILNDKEIDGSYKKSLLVCNKYLKEDDWKNIHRYVSNNDVKSLELSGVNIDSLGLNFLCETVSNIYELKLEWNDLVDAYSEFDCLLEALIKSSCRLIFLNNNKICHLHIHSICKLIKHASNMTLLDLRWNEINDDGAKQIYECMKKNTTLLYLNLVGNKITNNQVLKEINDILIRNKEFQEKLIEDNDVKIKNIKNLREIDFKFDKNEHLSKLLLFQDHSNLNRLKNNSSLGHVLLEKEKDIAEEFKARYDVQIIQNSKLEKRIHELEHELNNEKQKKISYKEEYEKLSFKEKQERNLLEMTVMNLREQISKMELNHKKHIDSIELELEKSKNQNNLMNAKNQELSEANERIAESFKIKFNVMNDKRTEENEKNAEKIRGLYSDLEFLKKNFEDSIKSQSDQTNQKFKSMEELKSSISKQNELLVKENNMLKAMINDINVDKQLSLSEQEKKLKLQYDELLSSEIRQYLSKISTLKSINEDLMNKLKESNDLLTNLRKTQLEELKDYETRTVKPINEEIIKIKKQNVHYLNKQNEDKANIKSLESINHTMKLELIDLKNEKDRLFNEKNREIKQIENINNKSMETLQLELDNLKVKYNDLLRINENYKKSYETLELKNFQSLKDLKKKIKDI